MDQINQKQIEDLIVCDKKIITPPHSTMQERQGSYRNDMVLESLDGKHKFYVIMRKNVAFEENYSVGLVLLTNDGPRVNLYRCNGPHGPTNFSNNPHFNHHIHKANATHLMSGLKTIGESIPTQEFSTFEDALSYFVHHCKIEDAEKYFNFFSQIDWLTDSLDMGG